MSFWRELVILVVVVIVASAIVGKLLQLAVLQIYPDADPAELYWKINTVLVCLTGLGVFWWLRR
jgi:hypothetical protein